MLLNSIVSIMFPLLDNVSDMRAGARLTPTRDLVGLGVCAPRRGLYVISELFRA